MKHKQLILISIIFTIMNGIVASGLLIITVIGFIYLVGKTESLGIIYTLLLVIGLEVIFLGVLWRDRVYMKQYIGDISLTSIWIIQAVCLFGAAITMNALGLLFFGYILPLTIYNFTVKNIKSLIALYWFNSLLVLITILIAFLLS